MSFDVVRTGSTSFSLRTYKNKSERNRTSLANYLTEKKKKKIKTTELKTKQDDTDTDPHKRHTISFQDPLRDMFKLAFLGDGDTLLVIFIR